MSRRFVLATTPEPPWDRDWLAPEAPLVERLAAEARLSPQHSAAVEARAAALVRDVRAAETGLGGTLERFLQEFSLDSEEGVLLMCLAEALLRIPDADTADELIADKLGAGRWRDHLGGADSLLVDASTWGLLLTGRLLSPDAGRVAALMGRLGEPVIRTALRQAMKILGRQFVAGRTIDEALREAAPGSSPRVRHSFDMLGEAAITRADAERYVASYREAIRRIGAVAARLPPSVRGRPGLSVKLSALHPRYEPAQRERVLQEVAPVLRALVVDARDAGIPLTLDAEESERLGLSLELLDTVLRADLLRDYEGLGLAVQAYQKRAPALLDWLVETARARGVRVAVRLVKGAYWDTEIKRAQERGLSGYPVYTRKASTDVAWLACAQRLARCTDVVFPQFATHNAHAVAYVSDLFAGRERAFEFQRLHGMGEALYAQLPAAMACRIYAPVGPHRDLLPYLVRRLLENGANTSFVNRVSDAGVPVEDVVGDPVARVDRTQPTANPQIALPVDIHGTDRPNARGLNLASAATLGALEAGCERLVAEPPAVPDEIAPGAAPALIERAAGAQPPWEALGGDERARLLERAADRLEAEQASLVALCVLEAGRTVPNALAEQREAVDFLRYYAIHARRLFDVETTLPGVAGEQNRLRLRPRGVFVCISPWNFPLSIFTGQLAAALAAGNAVVAKPAPQTPRCAARIVDLLHGAGIPVDALILAPGGPELGAALVAAPLTAGVAFTGSTAAAARIAASLAGKPTGLVPLIAETGGINAILADSSALPEQLVKDAIVSAFDSAGQRCSAARLLFVQDDIAPRVLELLAGAMDELVVGDPARLDTDVGPVIDAAALQRLRDYREGLLRAAGPRRWRREARLSATAGPLAFAPLAVEITADELPASEVFGPILHVVRFAGNELEAMLDRVNALGYGLTLGLHTRIVARAEALARRARVGNVYVNRTTIGAVVGAQPFGGTGLSGTGPKAGGPHYVQRFTWEQTISIDTSAVGGNASLLGMPTAD